LDYSYRKEICGYYQSNDYTATFSLYLLLIAILFYTAVAEEKFLRKRFLKYKDYLKITGRFFPKINTEILKSPKTQRVIKTRKPKYR